VALGLIQEAYIMIHTTRPQVRPLRKPIPWPQHLFVALLFFIALITLVAWFSQLSAPSTPIVNEARLELSLSGAIGTNIVLTGEDVSDMLSCKDTSISFAQPATNELYGLTWMFQMPEALSRPTIFTLGSTFPLTLSLVSQGGAYRTFTATEGEFSFDPESKRGYFTAFLYDENGERTFANAAWQCK
jgi:hypothetical protein